VKARGCRAEVIRSGKLESVHRCAVVVADAAGEVKAAWGDWRTSTYLRSCGKFLQAVAVVVSGAADAFGFSDRELVAACASHGARPDQLAAVRGLLHKAGLSESLLTCPPHPPLEDSARLDLVRSGASPTAIHNNCSGKHAAMLATALYKGWSLEGYARPEHPVQQLALEVVAALCALTPKQIHLGVDGCGVPTFYMPLRNLAIGFARFATGEGLPPDLANAVARLRRAVTRFPELTSTLDFPAVKLMQLSAGRILSKGGAEGLMAACDVQTGLGFAVKAFDGNHRGSCPVLVSALKRVLELPPDWQEALAPLERVVLQASPEGAIAEVVPYLE